jgi:hypothetical protein
MQLNPQPNIRDAIYTVSALVVPVAGYLFDQGKLNSFWFGLILVINTAVLGLAKFNVTQSK